MCPACFINVKLYLHNLIYIPALAKGGLVQPEIKLLSHQLQQSPD